ncbi:MAG: divergent polysaccharide deacetylase family protein, partial [Pseudomonadota bacterium]
MSSEDLTAPLGMGKRRLVRLPFGLIGVGLLSVFITTTLIWVAVVDDPLGGEPVAVIPLEATVEGVTSQDIEVVEIRPGLNDDLGPNLRPDAGQDLLGPRYNMVQRPDGKGPEAPVESLSANPDTRVSERSEYGFL